MQKTDAVNARLTVEVQESDYKDKVVKDLKEIGRTHQIPGFRKGHISIADLQRRFGQRVTSDVINREVYEAVMKYIEDNKLNVLGQPVPVEVKALDLKNQKDFTFEYDLALAPELNIEVDKNVTLPFYTIEVTDEMVANQDDSFRKRFGSQVPGEEVEPDALVKGPIMELNPDGTIKEGDDAIQVTNGILGPQFFKNDAQRQLFIGKKVDDKVRFNPWETCDGDPVELASMLQLTKEQVADLHADFEMVISEIIVVKKAELGEEFYTQVFGKDRVKTEDEYRAALRELIAGDLRQNSQILFARDVKKYFMDKYGQMELPAATLKKWLIERNESLNEKNIDEEFAKMEDDLRWQLIRDEIAAKLNLEVTQDDLLAFAKMIASRQLAQYGMTNLDDETITSFAKNILDDKNYHNRLVDQVREGKFYHMVEQAVTLDQQTVSLDRFRELAQ